MEPKCSTGEWRRKDGKSPKVDKKHKNQKANRGDKKMQN